VLTALLVIMGMGFNVLAVVVQLAAWRNKAITEQI